MTPPSWQPFELSAGFVAIFWLELLPSLSTPSDVMAFSTVVVNSTFSMALSLRISIPTEYVRGFSEVTHVVEDMEIGVVKAVVVLKVVVVVVVVMFPNCLSELAKTAVVLGVAFDVVDTELGPLVGDNWG